MKITKNILREMIEAEMLNEKIGMGVRPGRSVERLSTLLGDGDEEGFMNLFNNKFKKLTADDWEAHPELVRILTTANAVFNADSQNTEIGDALAGAPATLISSIDSAQARADSEADEDDVTIADLEDRTALQNNERIAQMSAQGREAIQKLYWIFAGGVLSRGSRKTDDVKALQQVLLARLAQNGLTSPAQEMKDASPDGSGVDGDFGGKTEDAVRALQSEYGIQVDGSVGQQTLTSLISNTGTHGVAPSRVASRRPARDSRRGPIATLMSWKMDGDDDGGGQLEIFFETPMTRELTDDDIYFDLRCVGGDTVCTLELSLVHVILGDNEESLDRDEDIDGWIEMFKRIDVAAGGTGGMTSKFLFTFDDDVNVNSGVWSYVIDNDKRSLSILFDADEVEDDEDNTAVEDDTASDAAQVTAQGADETTIHLQPVDNSEGDDIEWIIDIGDVGRKLETYGTARYERGGKRDLDHHDSEATDDDRETYDYFARISVRGFQYWNYDGEAWVIERNTDADYVKKVKPDNLEGNGGPDGLWDTMFSGMVYESVNKKAGETILSEARFKKLAGI